jgi:ATP-dependent protease Clp ATPase subunit
MYELPDVENIEKVIVTADTIDKNEPPEYVTGTKKKKKKSTKSKSKKATEKEDDAKDKDDKEKDAGKDAS